MAGALCAPVATGPSTPVTRRLLTDGSSALVTAARAAMDSGQTQTLAVKRLQIVACPIKFGTKVAGALVLARDPFRSGEHAPDDVGVPAAWLAHAVEAHLLADENHSAADASDGIAALHRAVHAAAERGTDRDVVLAFSETLAIARDLEVRGYTEDARGHLILSVESRSGSHSTAPDVLDATLVPNPSSTLTRIAEGAASKMGFRRDCAVMVARLTGAPATWVIALAGTISEDDETLLALYAAILQQAMAGALVNAEARLTRAIAERLLGATEGQDANAALDELARAFDALGAALVVTASHGMRLLTAGDGDVVEALRPTGAPEQLVSSIKVDDDTALVAVRRPDGETFTKHDQQLLDRMASLFGAWLPTALQRTPSARERRSVNREFEQIIERTAARTIEEGADVSALVISVDAGPLPPGVLHRWAAQLRARLRGSDVAGTLSEREIGVLLPGTGPVGAVAVGTRIQQRLESDDEETPFAAVIGLASRAPGSTIGGSIVQAAREDASRRGRIEEQAL